MLSIRFSRVGKTKQPTYRLIAVDKKKDPWGKYIELLGNYNPRTKKAVFKAERIKYWISVGAQASETVYNILIKENIIQGKKRNAVRMSTTRKTKVAEKNKAAAEKIQAKAEKAAAAAQEEVKPAEEVKEESKPEEPQTPAAEEVKTEEPAA